MTPPEADETRRPLQLASIEARLPYASNTTLLARSDTGELWVYKPESGEEPLWDFAWRTLATREVLTYRVSEAMGLGLVPETVLVHGPLGRGSAQRFLAEDTDFDPRLLLTPDPDPILWPFAVLDIVTNNADRKIGHIMKERPSGRLWAIDNGLTFHAEPKLRTVLWGLAGRTLPEAMVEAVMRVSEVLEAGLCEEVAALLSWEEADALMARIRTLLQAPVHPYPPTDRSALPWPLW